MLKIVLYYLQTALLMTGPLPATWLQWLQYYNFDMEGVFALFKICVMPIDDYQVLDRTPSPR
jgi:hypothetical protein